MARASGCLVVEAPRTFTLAQNDTQKGNKNPEDTKRRCVTQGREGGYTRYRGHKNMKPTTRDRQGTDLLFKADRGGSGRADDGDRKR